MLPFFTKKNETSIEELPRPLPLPRLELVSIHIPKTAGTSFLDILHDQYGKKEVQRVDIVGSRMEINQANSCEQEALENCRVIHGHFRLDHLKERFSVDWEQVKLITWLREPSERVISNYFYLAGMLDSCVDKEKFPNLLPKMQRTLIEYARYDKARNRISGFLRGLEPDDFDFLGLTSQFDQDVQRLAKLLDWKKPVSVYHHNETRKKDRQIAPEIHEEIRSLNEKDYRWYDRAVSLAAKS